MEIPVGSRLHRLKVQYPWTFIRFAKAEGVIHSPDRYLFKFFFQEVDLKWQKVGKVFAELQYFSQPENGQQNCLGLLQLELKKKDVRRIIRNLQAYYRNMEALDG